MGPGELLRYPEGTWFSIISTLVIWPEGNEDVGFNCLYINTPDPPKEISGRGRIALLTVDELLANLSCNGAHHVLGCKVSLETKRITC